MTESTPDHKSAPDELKPVFVSCTAGTNAFTDCMVKLSRNGVLLNGHPEMLFNRSEAITLANALLRFAGQL